MASQATALVYSQERGRHGKAQPWQRNCSEDPLRQAGVDESDPAGRGQVTEGHKCHAKKFLP